MYGFKSHFKMHYRRPKTKRSIVLAELANDQVKDAEFNHNVNSKAKWRNLPDGREDIDKSNWRITRSSEQAKLINKAKASKVQVTWLTKPVLRLAYKADGSAYRYWGTTRIGLLVAGNINVCRNSRLGIDSGNYDSLTILWDVNNQPAPRGWITANGENLTVQDLIDICYATS